MYRIITIITLCFLAAFSYDSILVQASPASKQVSATHPGKAIYEEYCLSCHQADGKGVPGMNPPISKTDWVTGEKTRLINVLLKGLKTPLTINGQLYRNPMPAHSFLTDQQIADVLTYVRSNFGNKASAITAMEVKSLRTQK